MTPRYLAGIERGERNLTLDSVDALAVQLAVPALALLDAEAEHFDRGPGPRLVGKAVRLKGGTQSKYLSTSPLSAAC